METWIEQDYQALSEGHNVWKERINILDACSFLPPQDELKVSLFQSAKPKKISNAYVLDNSYT